MDGNKNKRDAKFVLITRKSRLAELVVRYNTVQQARFYIERLGADFGDYMQEDQDYKVALASVQQQLAELGRVQLVNRAYVPNFIFGPEDIVVVLGQDGLVANTMKYLSGQPLVAVNPDPLRWDGVLLPFLVHDVKAVVRDVLQGYRSSREVTLAQATLNDGQNIYAVNDLFIGRRTHVSARYLLQLEGRQETQSSSGVIVSTGLGSTGWLSSVMTGASRVAEQVTGQRMSWNSEQLRQSERQRAEERQTEQPIEQNRGMDMNRYSRWSLPELFFTVREPFVSRTTGGELACGCIEQGQQLRITSQMPEQGVIFSDGMEEDYLEFNAGVEAIIRRADKAGSLVV
ncbi:NAD(+)/NADH kinase [Paenibacillus massiliensis]|uniref:sugar kinase n=1 Tax=Paenibacillus massiliensis TaxID=225917 RepID=UPI0003FA0703|nr:sugar kinase [Paenibacillus massiliensis]